MRTAPRGDRPAAFGLIGFAAVMMILIGVFHVFMGIVAIAKDQFYVSVDEYIVEFDPTTWGWIHVIAGVIVVIAGFGVFSGKTWARAVGIVLASVSMILNFAFLPYYPLWALTVIALCVCIIAALANQGHDYPARDTSRTL